MSCERAALIKAAQGFIAAEKLNAPVLEISQAADVGMGSFYNHFDSKEELFQAALNEIFHSFGALLDRLPACPLTKPVKYASDHCRTPTTSCREVVARNWPPVRR